MRRLTALFALTLLVPPLAARAQSTSTKSRLANAIAVIVNDSVITYADIEQSIASSVEMAIKTHGRNQKAVEEEIARARQAGIEQLVERELILGDWKTGGFALPEKILEEEVNDRIRERYGDRVKVTKSLQAEGMTWEAFRKQVRDDFIVNVLRTKNAGSQSIIISPQKIESYYVENRDKYQLTDQVKLRIIAITQKPGNPGGARKLLEEIRGKIKEGAAFSELASVYSEGSERSKGGDWGWVTKATLRPELDAAAFVLKAGELSPVIETPDTCYLLLAEQVKAAHVQPLSDVRDLIERDLLTRERSRLQQKYIEKLKAKSFVRYF